jgi:hypothetical protein
MNVPLGFETQGHEEERDIEAGVYARNYNDNKDIVFGHRMGVSGEEA